jgi:Micrococcal nuclease (thermonuclease) homologs
MGNCTGNCISHVIDNIGPTLHQHIIDLAGTTALNSTTHHGHQLPTSAVYEILPSIYEKHRVIRVYDGDTLTLENDQRVRLIGIDTPEIKQSQPFSQEAKQFLSDCCLEEDIFLSFEDVNDKHDHYGRLVAWIWIKIDSGFLNVNEALVGLGLASFYNPGKNPFHNQSKMLSLQKYARENKSGKWIDYKDSEVIKTRNGRCYHANRQCSHLSKSRNLITILESEALDSGLSACRSCFA